MHAVADPLTKQNNTTQFLTINCNTVNNLVHSEWILGIYSICMYNVNFRNVINYLDVGGKKWTKQKKIILIMPMSYCVLTWQMSCVLKH